MTMSIEELYDRALALSSVVEDKVPRTWAIVAPAVGPRPSLISAGREEAPRTSKSVLSGRGQPEVRAPADQPSEA